MTLELTGLRKEYPTGETTLLVLRDVSFTLRPGESMAVVGPSGSGKSTLLNIIGTLDAPTAGNVQLNGRDLAGLDERELARLRNSEIGFIFQDHHLLPQCTALENVLLPTLGAGAEERRAALARGEELLEAVGLAERMDHFPAALSGGERQRVATARAMINEPVLLLADEPTGNLDSETGRRMADLFEGMIAERDVMLVVATHDPELAERFGDVHELRDGALHPRNDGEP